MVAVFTVIAGTLYKQHLDVENERNSKFIPVYEKFIDLLVLLRDEEFELEARYQYISKIDKGMYKWGNYRVRKIWEELRSNLSNKEIIDNSIMQKFTPLLLAMRRQVGHPEEKDTLTKNFLARRIKPLNEP